MKGLSPLERAVLNAIALQVPEAASALAQHACVTARENTGAGFYTTLDLSSSTWIEGVASPVGDVEATVDGLKYGMGFTLWVQDGRVCQLEGYSYEESTSALDFTQIVFGTVRARIRPARKS